MAAVSKSYTFNGNVSNVQFRITWDEDLSAKTIKLTKMEVKLPYYSGYSLTLGGSYAGTSGAFDITCNGTSLLYRGISVNNGDANFNSDGSSNFKTVSYSKTFATVNLGTATSYTIALTNPVCWWYYNGSYHADSSHYIPKASTGSYATGGFVHIYNGSSWVACDPYIYNGSSWIACDPYVYNGSSWVAIG